MMLPSSTRSFTGSVSFHTCCFMLLVWPEAAVLRRLGLVPVFDIHPLEQPVEVGGHRQLARHAAELRGAAQAVHVPGHVLSRLAHAAPLALCGAERVDVPLDDDD